MMSPRLLLIPALGFVAAAPVMAGLKSTTGAGGLAEVFSTPQPYATPLRLERTPRMDGVYRAEEWDILWGDKITKSSTVAPLAPASLAGTIGPAPTNPPKGVTLITPPPAGTATTGGKQDGNVPLVPTNIEPTTQAAAPAAPVSQAALMSWEPGKLYFGAILAPGNDMLVTIDAGNNGFLIGNDNLEIRVTPGSSPTVRARILNATAATGPAWTEAPGFAMASTVVSTVRPDGSVFVELAVTDPGYNLLHPQLKNEFGLRVDAIPTSAAQAEAFLPRLVTKVQLTDQRTTNFPVGIDATVGTKGRSVLAGESTSMRWNLTGTDAMGLKSMEISGEGGLFDQVNFLRVPSPTFDPRGQAAIDYATRVVSTTPVGYGVLKGELSGDKWNSAFIESSVRIAPPIDIDAPAKRVVATAKPLNITCKADIISNTGERMEGNFQVIPPAGWTVVDGTNKSFFIYDKGAKAKRQFVLAAPAGTRGTFKATIRIVALGGAMEQPYWITIQ